MFARPYLALIALAGALLGATVAARAQTAPYPMPTPPAAANGAPAPGGPGRQHHPGPLRAAMRQLQLTSDQRSQIVAILRQFRASRNTDTPMTPKERRAQIEAVLTPQQRTTFRQLMHRRPQQRQQQQPQPPPNS